jgi:hypothetical protein
MVISYKIIERAIGNRGSKSILEYNIVKEQRVDGSWWIKPIHLRYTLIETNFLLYLTIYLTKLD